MPGTIQSRRTGLGFGGIRDVQGGGVCCHHTALPSPDHCGALTGGTVVEFEAEPGPKGPQATTVRRVSKTSGS
jgi:cold shock CspA family protein